jgi:hypothetical protein
MPTIVRGHTYATATSTHTGLIYTGLIKQNSERFVGVATLLDNSQGSTQAFLAPWLRHVTCSLKVE